MRNPQPDAAMTPGNALATRMGMTFPAEKVVGTRLIGGFPPGKVTGTRAGTALPAAKVVGSRMMTTFPAGKVAIGWLGAAFSEISGGVGSVTRRLAAAGFAKMRIGKMVAGSGSPDEFGGLHHLLPKDRQCRINAIRLVQLHRSG